MVVFDTDFGTMKSVHQNVQYNKLPIGEINDWNIWFFIIFLLLLLSLFCVRGLCAGFDVQFDGRRVSNYERTVFAVYWEIYDAKN